MGGTIVARNLGRAFAVALTALAAAAAWPTPAGAEEPLLDSLLKPLLAVPAATLPGSTRVLDPGDEPARSADDPTPLAYIKERVELRVFRGAVVSVHTASAQIVVRTKRRTAAGRIVRRRQAFDLTGAKLTVADTNGDGATSIGDIRRGDRVRLRAAVGRGPLRAVVPLAVRDLVDKGEPVKSKRRGRRLRGR
jgi:hypothetical protein